MELTKTPFDEICCGLDYLMCDLVKPKGTLLTSCLLEKIVEGITAKIKMFPNYATLRGSLELIKLVANLIENIDCQKLSKEDIAVGVFRKLFTLTEPEVVVLKAHIKFICDHGIIKKITNMKKLRKFLYRLLKAFLK